MSSDKELQSSGSGTSNHESDIKLMGLAVKGQTIVTRTCSELGLGADVLKLASTHWQEMCAQDDDLKGDFVPWTSCAVYIASIDTRLPYGLTDPQAQAGSLTQPQVTVSQLLKHSKVNILDFFKKMGELKEFHPVSDAVHSHLLALERKFCITSAVYHKFNRIFEELVRKDDNPLLNGGESRDNRISSTESYSHKKKMCWTLFIYAKGRLLGTSEGIVTGFHLLLCCIDHVLASTPGFMLMPPFDVAKNNGENQQDYILQQICSRFGAGYEEVRSVQRNYFQPFLQKLTENNESLDIEQLEKSYTAEYRVNGDIDELLFLVDDPHLVVQPKNRSAERTGQVEIKYTREHPPVTPVRSALNTVQQLRVLLNHAKDEPSPELLRYFENCAKDPSDTIQSQLEALQQAFVLHFIQESGGQHQQLAQQRFTLAVRLYYRVLQAMLKQEEERLSKLDFSNLLNKTVFHKSLHACCVEVVMTTYGTSGSSQLYSSSSFDSCFSFPWILRVFDIHGYDFYKVLESFIKAEPNLTRDIIKHLQSIENQILETTAWEAGSPLFDALAKFEVTQPSVPVPSNSELAHSSATAADLYLSPMRPGQTAVNTIGTPTSPMAPPPHSPRTPEHSPQTKQQPSPRRSQSLNLFFNKVCRLGYHRLQLLCALLPVTKDLQHKIWTCFEHCITQRPELLRNRHLDQIMMCSVYSICKVVEREIKFKLIVQMYRSLPHSSQEVYRSVKIEDGIRDSIIGFYNRIFMHKLKSYILQFSSSRVNVPSLSPIPKNVPSPLKASPMYSIPGRKNFYISPMKESPFKMPPSPGQLTPRSRQLYSFGEGFGSSEKLKNINETMRIIGRKRISTPGISRGHQKCLKFDDSTVSEYASAAEVKVTMAKPSPHMRKCLAFPDTNEGEKNTKQ